MVYSLHFFYGCYISICKKKPNVTKFCLILQVEGQLIFLKTKEIGKLLANYRFCLNLDRYRDRRLL